MFIFKHMTAYKMRISDCSSDVCTSELVQMDRYKARGPRQRMKTLEEALELSKSQWPGADFEGSTGFERSSAVRDDGIQWLVAHTWMDSRHIWWLRIASSKTRIPLN